MWHLGTGFCLRPLQCLPPRLRSRIFLQRQRHLSILFSKKYGRDSRTHARERYPPNSCSTRVISFPKRIRHYLQTDEILQKVLRIVAYEIKKKVIICSPKIPNSEFGAVSFIQRFGNTLNVHPHFHFIVADGVLKKMKNHLIFTKPFLPRTTSQMHKMQLKRVF